MQEGTDYILVAEDDADDRFLLQSAFREQAYTEELVFVDNGIELMNTLQSLRSDGKTMPRVILLDLNMPKKDGRESLREIRSVECFARIPVVVFSTTDNKLEIERCYALGADSYILKPDSFSSYLSAIKDIHTRWMSNAGIANAHN